MVCAHCNRENPADTLYCGQCGRGLQTGDPSTPRYADRTTLLRRELAFVFFGIVALLAAAYGAWYVVFYQRSPVAVVRGFLDADVAGQYSREEEYVAPGAGSRFILASFQTFRKQSGASPFKGYNITGSSTSGNSAYVNVNIPAKTPTPGGTPFGPMPGSSATSMTITFALVRQNNTWKIEPAETLASAAGVLATLGYQTVIPSLPGLLAPGAMPNLGNLGLPNLGIPNPGLPPGMPAFPGGPVQPPSAAPPSSTGPAPI
jgi:hypothetical protein